MVTDGCSTGVAGFVCQGDNWRKAPIAVFYSAKLNSSQQNYTVLEIKMLAGVKMMLRHCDILQGLRFTWVTDHKALIYLLTQKDLKGHQACWLEKIGKFNFTIKYEPGESNIIVNVLSQIYSNNVPGTVQTPSRIVSARSKCCTSKRDEIYQ